MLWRARYAVRIAPTCVLSVQSRCKFIVQLQEECSGLGEQGRVPSDIFQVRPDDTVARCGLRRGCAPNFRSMVRQESLRTMAGYSLSTSWNVSVPRRSYCVPLDVTVKFRLMPVQEPTVPQSVGGLWMRQSISQCCNSGKHTCTAR